MGAAARELGLKSDRGDEDAAGSEHDNAKVRAAQNVVARLTAWRDDEVGTLEVSGQEDAMIDAHHPARVMIAVRKSPFAYADEDSFCDNLVLLLAIEDSTSTQAVDEAAIIIRFFPAAGDAARDDRVSESGLAAPLLAASAGLPPVDARDATVPPWVRRRCKNVGSAASPTKVWFMDVRTEHRLCQLREGYRDMISVGQYHFWLRLQWTVSRSNLASRFDRVWFMPSLDQEFLREQFMDHVENATRPATSSDSLQGSRALLLQDRAAGPSSPAVQQHHQRARLSAREWAIIGWQGVGEGTPADVEVAIIEEGQINAGTAALRFVSYLEAHRVAACVPLTLSWVQELARTEGISIVDLLLSRPDLLVLCILMLAKVTDDSPAQDAIGVSMIAHEIATVASEACLASLLEIFARILTSTAATSRDKTSSAQSPRGSAAAAAAAATATTATAAAPSGLPRSNTRGGDVARTGAGAGESGPNDHTAVVAATGTVVMALLCRDEPSSDPELLRETLDRVFCLVCRARNLEVAWAGATRLFPVSLVACSTSVTARELVKLMARSLRAAKSATPQLKVGLDYWMACAAHLLQRFDPVKSSFVWARDILPSAEEWVQLHLISPSVALATVAVQQSADLDDQGDGFDALTLTLLARIRTIRSSAPVPTKMDAGLMTPGWAVSQTWTLSRALVRLTCRRKTVASTATLPLLQLLSVEPAPDASERLGSARMTLLQSLVAAEDSISGRGTLETLRMLFHCMLIHVSTVYAGPFVPEIDIAKMTAQLVTLLMALKDSHRSSAQECWRAAFDLLLFAARTWEDTEHAGWALLTVREVISSFLETFVETRRGTDQEAYDFEARTIGVAPWFAAPVAHGLMRVCTTRGVSPEVVDEAVRVLNVLLAEDSGGCSATVCQVCKLDVLDSSKAPRMELDRWLLVLEDLCINRTLPDDLFALRALAKASQLDPSSAALRFSLIQSLVGLRLSSIWWPWAPPPPELTQRRRVMDRSRLKSDPEVRLLSAASGLHAEALYRIDRDAYPHDFLLPAAVGIQLGVAQLLCGALDDLDKDAIVRDLEVLLDTCMQTLDVAGSKIRDFSQGTNGGDAQTEASAQSLDFAVMRRRKQAPHAMQAEYWTRLAAVTIAIVEDALKEPLGFLWSRLAQLPPARVVLDLNRVAFSIHGCPARRLVAYDGTSWFALAFDPRRAVDDVPALLASPLGQQQVPGHARRGGLALEWNGQAQPRYATSDVLRFPCDPLIYRDGSLRMSTVDHEAPKDTDNQVFMHVFSTIAVRGNGESPYDIRVFARTQEPDRALRINLRPGKKGNEVDARGERAALGPDVGMGVSFLGEDLHLVSVEEIPWVEAAQEYLFLSIRYLRSCLEHEAWLPNSQADLTSSKQQEQQEVLFLNMANTVLDAMNSKEGISLHAIFQLQREGNLESSALYKAARGFHHLAETVCKSLEKNLDDTLDDEITQLLVQKRASVQAVLATFQGLFVADF
ncbi:Hypothetical Protein FCC1311_086892 [Hondaea fermentalgiana]|uniref:Uncharacterized protein n=1 Tax=Hondaea fermentalgiana TaxID=2315210 RepID=A0A2R5GWZ8_9STRA|nr:Hypothetical Protein FCC1311_086892 [Hondaea fermentalgiana]|eukprot:GBG32464.1 Hypothetical Protein FCC1311_086892 [Hondaea fermentalgiana]